MQIASQWNPTYVTKVRTVQKHDLSQIKQITYKHKLKYLYARLRV